MTAKEILALAQAHRSEPSLANYQALADAVKVMERERDDANTERERCAQTCERLAEMVMNGNEQAILNRHMCAAEIRRGII